MGKFKKLTYTQLSFNSSQTIILDVKTSLQLLNLRQLKKNYFKIIYATFQSNPEKKLTKIKINQNPNKPKRNSLTGQT